MTIPCEFPGFGLVGPKAALVVYEEMMRYNR
jgi:hypothetical protein